VRGDCSCWTPAGLSFPIAFLHLKACSKLGRATPHCHAHAKPAAFALLVLLWQHLWPWQGALCTYLGTRPCCTSAQRCSAVIILDSSCTSTPLPPVNLCTAGELEAVQQGLEGRQEGEEPHAYVCKLYTCMHTADNLPSPFHPQTHTYAHHPLLRSTHSHTASGHSVWSSNQTGPRATVGWVQHTMACRSGTTPSKPMRMVRCSTFLTATVRYDPFPACLNNQLQLLTPLIIIILS
jgi:hypothetical protein